MRTRSFPSIPLPAGKESILLPAQGLSILPCPQHPPGKGHLLLWQKNCHATKATAECRKPCRAIDPGRVETSSKLRQLKNLCTQIVTIWKARLCSHCLLTWENGLHSQHRIPPDQYSEQSQPSLRSLPRAPAAGTVQPAAGLEEQRLMPALPAPKHQMSPGQIYFQILTQSQYWICNHRLQF